MTGLVVVTALPAVLVIVACWYGGDQRRRHMDSVTAVLRHPDLRDLDAALSRSGEDALRRLDADEVQAYTIGAAGHVGAVSKSRKIVVIALSDGRWLELEGVPGADCRMLIQRVAGPALRPTGVHQAGAAFLLQMRDEAGDEFQIKSRRVALARR